LGHVGQAAATLRSSLLVLQGAEEPFDDAVGLWAPHSGSDVPQQRVVASERVGEHGPAEARPVVGDDRDRCWCLADDVVVASATSIQPRSARRSSSSQSRSATARRKHASPYLRRKLDCTEPRLIHTIRGVGYVMRLPD
jgi:hypothetical protein